MEFWFKHYVDASVDHKLIKVAAKTGEPLERVAFCWMRLLESALAENRSGAYAMAPEMVAWILRCEPEPIIAIYEAFEDIALIADGCIVNWLKRQARGAKKGDASASSALETSEDRAQPEKSTARVQKCRQRKRDREGLLDDPAQAARIGSDETHETRDETLRNAGETHETPLDSRIRERDSDSRESAKVVTLHPRATPPAKPDVFDDGFVLERLIDGTDRAISRRVATSGLEEVLSWIRDGYDLELDILPFLATLPLAEPLRTLKAGFLLPQLSEYRERRLSPAAPAPPVTPRRYPRAPPGLMRSASPAALSGAALRTASLLKIATEGLRRDGS